MITKRAAAVELLRRRRAREDIRAFASAVEVPGKPASEDPDEWLFRPIETSLAEHHGLLLQALQETMETPHGRLMVFMPPGSAKSTYGSVVAPTWYMGKFPDRRIILASYGSDLARRHGRRARYIARQSAYKSIFGAGISAETSAADEWALSNGSEYFAGGILSGITGNRAHGLIIDDPVKGREDADSETIQKKTIDAYQDDLLTRLVPGGWIVIIQTRWSMGDLAGRILPENWAGESGDILCRDGQTWRVLSLQAQCERADDPLGRGVGEYLWPQWFTDRHWAIFKKQARTWSALYQQVPIADSGDYFKKDQLNRYDRPPKHLRTYGASDYAVTADGGDFTEHGVFGLDPEGELYILDWWFGQTASDEWIETELDLVDKWKPLAWVGEAGPIRRAVEPFLMRRMKARRSLCRLEWLPSIHDKPTRARAFQAMVSSGMVHLPRNAEWADRLERQLLTFPVGVFDDAVDVCSLIGRFVDQMRDARVPDPVEERPKPGTFGHLLELTDEPDLISKYRSVKPR
jgi:predicted phage terminase large subunit-like protein